MSISEKLLKLKKQTEPKRSLMKKQYIDGNSIAIINQDFKMLEKTINSTIKY